MKLLGHSKYDTTFKYYLAVKDELVDKARRDVRHRVSKERLERCLGGISIFHTLFFLNIERHQDITVTDIKPTITHNRMCPMLTRPLSNLE